jgi:UDP-2,4-diacetamido-2,4,6-trideoxy-beta-L-altropyranose hydrolase
MGGDQPGICDAGSGMSRACGNVLVRADASAEIGAGHIMRCVALGSAWQDAGADVTFACAEILPALQQRLQEHKFAVVAMEGKPGSEEDAQYTAKLAQDLSSAWMIVDGYQFRPDYYRHLRGQRLRCVAIDDDGRFDEYCADVVLNSNAAANEGMYVKRQRHTQLLLGSRFALLRPKFRDAATKRECRKVARNLLVTMGGSDPQNVTLKVVQALIELAAEGVEVRVVAGSGYRHLEQLRACTGRMRGEVCVEENPAEMAPLMAWADIAVSAAGGTCWELACMGVPAVVIAISEDQCGSAQAVADQGTGCNLGWHSDVSPRVIKDAVQMLSADRERRQRMSTAGQNLVDGRGPRRVVEFLRGMP